MTDNNKSAPTSYNPWRQELHFIAQWRLGAWLPWLLVHIPASWIIVTSMGPGGDLTAWLWYALLSWIACLTVIVMYFFRHGDILSYVIALTLLIAGPLLTAKYEENINPTPTAELRRWCDRDAGLKIHRVVRANGYFDAWASSYAPWRFILDTDYEFIEVCDEARRSYRPLAEPGCWRITKVGRDSGQCHPEIDAAIRKMKAPSYIDFSKSRCFAAEMLLEPRARYRRLGLLSIWELDNAWHSNMYRSINLFKDTQTDDVIAKEIYYRVHPKPDNLPFPSVTKSCGALHNGYEFKDDLIRKIVIPG